MNTVIVNKDQSIKIGKLVGQLRFKEEFLKRRFLNPQFDDELKAAMYYYAVGICHQTYHLAHPALNLYGWDYLEYGFMEIAKQKPELLNADFLVQLTPHELISFIKPFFSPNHDPKNCTLDALEERAHLWINMALLIKKNKKSHLEYFTQSNGEAKYFYENLSKCQAYADPLKKKTSFLMKLLMESHVVYFSNEQDLIPIMDYHMQRVLLRTGCVEVLDKSLNRALKNRSPLENDLEIREACIESMKLIARTSGFSIFKMNDVFYTLGRSCCNENMLCQNNICEKSPCSLSLAVYLENHVHCIFQSICTGAVNEEYRKFWQPQISTHFY